MSRFRSLLAMLLMTGALACASTPGAGAGGARTEPITAEELAAANVPNAYEAVSRLRQTWFRDRATGAPPVVYLANQRQQGGVGALRGISAREIAEIQYIPNREAVARWGLEAQGGAIIVVLK